MEPMSLTGTSRLIAGLLLGGAFGFFLIQSGTAWRKTILDQLAMKNGTLFKTIFSSLAIGIPLFYFAKNYGVVTIQTRPVFFWGALSGGMLFAAGIVLCGQFPSAAVASLSTGKIYSLWSFFGMLLALPSVHFLSKIISVTINKWPAPSFYADNIEKLFGTGQNLYFWTAAFAALMFFFFEFIQGGEDEGSDEKTEKE